MTDPDLIRLLGDLEESTVALHALMLRRDQQIGELRYELNQRRVLDHATSIVLGDRSASVIFNVDDAVGVVSVEPEPLVEGFGPGPQLVAS